MPSLANPDLSGLAFHAQNPGAELRPLLLRVHAQSFAAAKDPTAAATRAFETLALGLIPLVTSDTVAEVARLLHGIPHVPVSVLALLQGALCRTESPPPARLPAAGADAVVSRPDTSRRRDFLRADAAGRDAIRSDLSGACSAFQTPVGPAASRAFVSDLVASAAERGSAADVAAFLAPRLGLPPDFAAEVSSEAEQELLTLALVAAGLKAEICIRVFFAIGAGWSRSVDRIFRLMSIARATPAPAAACILGCSESENLSTVRTSELRRVAPAPPTGEDRPRTAALQRSKPAPARSRNDRASRSSIVIHQRS